MPANSIKKKNEELIKNERGLNKIKEQLKSQCTHTAHGELALVPSNERGSEGELKYICKLCNKVVTLSQINEEKLQDACATIDRAIDVIKITSGSLNTDDDAELLEKLSKMQYRVRNDLMPIYRAAIKKGTRKEKKQTYEGSTGWSRPMTLGGR